jgi:hypothetical protein
MWFRSRDLAAAVTGLGARFQSALINPACLAGGGEQIMTDSTDEVPGSVSGKLGQLRDLELGEYLRTVVAEWSESSVS